MTITYIDPETGIAHEKVSIDTFDTKDPTRVRIIKFGTKLSPEDKVYPDKKWVSIDTLRDTRPAVFGEAFRKANTH